MWVAEHAHIVHLREALHLDHDRKGISGSPELARTIFGKVDNATVLVADVTLVSEMPSRARIAGPIRRLSTSKRL